ncbi:hypothetical protein R1sor_012479 [Riccia sorocarpa]|uniref:Uncharacterized protein n=1 Tax=Riccia sorocarpa TaxID=122646 RepID=A0ABD3I3W6_9MARC
MSGCERNYDFADLIHCASGLNRLASMEYGEEKLNMGRSHAKQQTIWGKLHPLDAGESEPDLSDFSGLRTNAEIVDALKKGLQEAQDLLILLNMAPHAGVRNQAWWKTPWVCEKELGVFDKAAEVAVDPMDVEVQDTDQEMENLQAADDLWDLAVPQQPGGSNSEQEDGADDCEVVGHEARHLVGNPTLSKDRLTRIKQSIYFNGEKQKPRADGVPVCILDIGSDCAVLFDTESASRNTRSRRTRTTTTVSKAVWTGRAQKIRRKYNDLDSVITVVTMKVEHNMRTTWCLDGNDRIRLDEFIHSV